MIAPVSPAEFLPARLEGVSSKHEYREHVKKKKSFRKSVPSVVGFGWSFWAECCCLRFARGEGSARPSGEEVKWSLLLLCRLQCVGSLAGVKVRVFRWLVLARWMDGVFR